MDYYNVYEQHLKNTTKTSKELIEEKKRIIQLLSLEAMLEEKKLPTVSAQINAVSGTYDKYIPEEPNMFKR